MFESYKLRSCFTLIVTISLGSLLIRLGNLEHFDLKQTVTYVVMVSFYFFVAWCTQAYLIQHPLSFLGPNRRRIFVILCGTAITVIAYYVPTFGIPKTYMIEEFRVHVTWADLLKRLMGAFLITIISYSVLAGIYARQVLQDTQLENGELKQAHLRAQVIALQQQLSPHFLFNSLSTLKTMVSDQHTKSYIVQLSHVYRYLLSINERQLVEVREELAFVSSYLYILKYRFDSALTIDINIPERYLSYVIPPITLQLLIENAIKHNVLSADHPLQITISIENDSEISVINNLRLKRTPGENTHLGLQNISERFQLLCGKSIRIIQNDDYFIVSLPLCSK